MKYHTLRIACIGQDPTVLFAAEELIRCMKKMDTGLSAALLLADVPEYLRAIRVGTCLTDQLPTVDDPAQDDAIYIDASDGNGIITGTNPRSVLIAVYRFLLDGVIDQLAVFLGSDKLGLRPGQLRFRRS